MCGFFFPVIVVVCFLRQGFPHVAVLAVLEPAIVDQADLKLRDSPACLLSAGINGMCQHCLASFVFLLLRALDRAQVFNWVVCFPGFNSLSKFFGYSGH